MRTLVHFWWECKLVQSIWKTAWSHLKKFNNMGYDMMQQFHSEYTQKKQNCYAEKASAPSFIVPCSIIYSNRIWKQPKCHI